MTQERLRLPVTVLWMEQAECRYDDPDLFFPISNVGPGSRQIEEARAVCGVCTVRLECLLFAVETNQDAGIWGGLTPEERRAMQRSLD